MEFENFSSVNAKTRRSTPVEIRASTWRSRSRRPRRPTRPVSCLKASRPTGVEQHRHAVHRRKCISHSPRQDPSREIVDHRVHVGTTPVEQRMTVVSMCLAFAGSRASFEGPPSAWPGACGAGGDASRTCRTNSAQVEGGPDRAEPLRQDGERAGRDMPVLGRGHHVLDCPDFGWGQSMGRRVRTGRLIVKRTRVLQPSPGMEPTRRQSQEPGAPATAQTRWLDPRLAGS